MDLYEARQQLSLGMPLTNLKLRVTYYSRVSTDNIKQKNSLRNQIEHFDEMIKKNKNWTYVEGYVDDGITGTSDIKRDNFMRMIEDGKSGKFDLIITKEISRFSRNTLDSIKYTRELLQSGVAVLFVNDNINTALPDSELRLTIMASMAQDEIRRLSERVKFGMNRAIIDGHILGNDKLFGYNKNKITGNLEINDIEGKIIRSIYDMYVVEDVSLTKIVNYLNDNNIRTSFDKKFSVSTLSRMLRNPKYKGYYCGKKTEIIDYMTKKVKYFERDEWVMYEDKDRIPPLVSEEMWDRAFEKLQKRSKKFGKGFKDKIMYQNRYPLSAKLLCANHNTVFHRRKLSRNSDEIVWCCSQHLKRGKYTCDTPLVRQSELYKILDNIINTLSINLEEVTKMLFSMYQTNKKITSNREQLKKILNEKKHLNVVNERLIEILLNRIVIAKTPDKKNNIELKIYFNFTKEYTINEMKHIITDERSINTFLIKTYKFKRGFDKIGTKRYIVKYKVNCYICQ